MLEWVLFQCASVSYTQTAESANNVKLLRLIISECVNYKKDYPRSSLICQALSVMCSVVKPSLIVRR